MPKRSVRSLWFASVLALPCACALGDEPPMLSQDDLSKPAVVSAWLKENGAKADKARAKTFFDAGVKAKSQKRSGPAGKAFGESAGYYPTPQAINEYADITVRMLGETRTRNKDRHAHEKSDLASTESLYRSALAADAVLKSLSADEKQRTLQNADCVGIFIKSGVVQSSCPPLQTYGLRQ